ncbi:MAG: alpha/beta hydrolase-fold protein [Myxococcota bacterium]|nr:alpha/beta hydrolase-fold protein [Myxococcota bacterium]
MAPVLAVVPPPSAEVDARPRLEPIDGFFEPLGIPGHPDAWLSLPTGASERRPVVVVIHGSGDRPDWQCGGWRRATEGHAFVVCPRGDYAAASSTKSDVRYTHPGGTALLAHIDAALAALVLRYPDYADTGAPLLAGFSLGAWEVLGLAVQHPSRFPRVALIEGGAGGWTEHRIADFRHGGGMRVLLGCGQQRCAIDASVTAKALSRDGLDARVAYATVEHTFAPPLEDAVRANFSWLVEGDTRWEWHGPSR